MNTSTMQNNFALLFSFVREHLDPSSLAILARVCREWNSIVTPDLYHTVWFHNPGSITANDPLQRKLEILGDPRCANIVYTQRVLVTGSWYDSYHEIDANLGSYSILSPAARMLSNIITSCVIRMPNLKEFIWDLTVPATQHLVTTAMLMPNLEALQLRVGTDSTPSPYFRPSLNFCSPVNLTNLRLIQLDDKAILRSLGFALTAAVRLRELTVWAEVDSLLSFTDISSSWHQQVPFELNVLDLRGFVDLGRPPWALWNMLSPAKIKALILLGGPNCDPAGYSDFWEASIASGLRPQKLSTNLVVTGLKDFLHAFSGLERFSITSSSINVEYPAESLPLLLSALQKQHSTTLKVLSIDPQEALAKHLLDNQSLSQIAIEFPNIEEFRFGIVNVVSQVITSVLRLPKIRLLHICLGYNATVRDDTIVQQYVAHGLQQGLAKQLKYVVFGSGSPYRVVREPLQMVEETLPVEYIHDMSLFAEKVYDWVGTQWSTL